MRELNLPAEGPQSKVFCILWECSTGMASAASVGETAIEAARPGADCYFSELAREADMLELIELFVEELPEPWEDEPGGARTRLAGSGPAGPSTQGGGRKLRISAANRGGLAGGASRAGAVR